MSRLNFELSQQELDDLKNGKKISLGEIGEHREVTLTAEPCYKPAPSEVTPHADILKLGVDDVARPLTPSEMNLNIGNIGHVVDCITLPALHEDFRIDIRKAKIVPGSKYPGLIRQADIKPTVRRG